MLPEFFQNMSGGIDISTRGIGLPDDDIPFESQNFSKRRSQPPSPVSFITQSSNSARLPAAESTPAAVNQLPKNINLPPLPSLTSPADEIINSGSNDVCIVKRYFWPSNPTCQKFVFPST